MGDGVIRIQNALSIFLVEVELLCKPITLGLTKPRMHLIQYPLFQEVTRFLREDGSSL
jgi:hypothetical protein